MIILPAIDILKGECVRLNQGLFGTSEKVADSWLKTALSFKNAGAKWLHMVDLDGSLKGERVNSSIFTGAAINTRLKIQLGGGIRTMDDIFYYLSHGISRVVLGSAALYQPSLVQKAIKEYGSRIAVSIDAEKGLVKTSGWTKESGCDYIETAKRMEDMGVEIIIYTDIAKDGMLSGPNLEHLSRLKGSVSSKIIASGGIRDLADIRELCKLELYGAICGKSLYSGSLDLKQAISTVEQAG